VGSQGVGVAACRFVDRVRDDPFHGGHIEFRHCLSPLCPDANVTRTRQVAERGLAGFG
jgi:hypothetical protein